MFSNHSLFTLRLRLCFVGAPNSLFTKHSPNSVFHSDTIRSPCTHCSFTLHSPFAYHFPLPFKWESITFQRLILKDYSGLTKLAWMVRHNKTVYRSLVCLQTCQRAKLLTFKKHNKPSSKLR